MPVEKGLTAQQIMDLIILIAAVVGLIVAITREIVKRDETE